MRTNEDIPNHAMRHKQIRSKPPITSLMHRFCLQRAYLKKTSFRRESVDPAVILGSGKVHDAIGMGDIAIIRRRRVSKMTGGEKQILAVMRCRGGGYRAEESYRRRWKDQMGPNRVMI